MFQYVSDSRGIGIQPISRQLELLTRIGSAGDLVHEACCALYGAAAQLESENQFRRALDSDKDPGISDFGEVSSLPRRWVRFFTTNVQISSRCTSLTGTFRSLVLSSQE